MASGRTISCAPSAAASSMCVVMSSTVASRSSKTGVTCTAATVTDPSSGACSRSTSLMGLPLHSVTGEALERRAIRPETAWQFRQVAWQFRQVGDNGRVADVFVGRAGPLARLTSVLDDSVGGRAHLALVTGEAGIRKTPIPSLL